MTPSVSLLPPTDQIVPVTIDVVAQDIVDPAPACRITRVPAGATDLDNDASRTGRSPAHCR